MMAAPTEHCEAMQMDGSVHFVAEHADSGLGLHADCFDECPDCITFGAALSSSANLGLAYSTPFYLPVTEVCIYSSARERLLRPPISS